MGLDPVVMSVLYSLAGGLVGGFFSSYLIDRNFKYKNKVVFISTIISGVLIGRLLTNYIDLGPASIHHRMDKLAKKHKELFDVSENLVKYLNKLGKSERGIKLYDLANKGTSRLPNQELLSWIELKIKMAENDSIYCAAMWSGSVTQQIQLGALNSLEDKDLVEVMRIRSKAASLEFVKKKSKPIETNGFEKGLNVIFAELSDVEKVKFERASSQGAQANESLSCWAVLIMLKNAEKLNSGLKFDYIRNIDF